MFLLTQQCASPRVPLHPCPRASTTLHVPTFSTHSSHITPHHRTQPHPLLLPCQNFLPLPLPVLPLAHRRATCVRMSACLRCASCERGQHARKHTPTASSCQAARTAAQCKAGAPTAFRPARPWSVASAVSRIARSVPWRVWICLRSVSLFPSPCYPGGRSTVFLSRCPAGLLSLPTGSELPLLLLLFKSVRPTTADWGGHRSPMCVHGAVACLLPSTIEHDMPYAPKVDPIHDKIKRFHSCDLCNTTVCSPCWCVAGASSTSPPCRPASN